MRLELSVCKPEASCGQLVTEEGKPECESS